MLIHASQAWVQLLCFHYGYQYYVFLPQVRRVQFLPAILQRVLFLVSLSAAVINFQPFSLTSSHFYTPYQLFLILFTPYHSSLYIILHGEPTLSALSFVQPSHHSSHSARPSPLLSHRVFNTNQLTSSFINLLSTLSSTLIIPLYH